MAIPVAYYFYTMAFDIRLSYGHKPFVFIYAGGGVLVITLLTISFHAIKAAIANPVKSLRSE